LIAWFVALEHKTCDLITDRALAIEIRSHRDFVLFAWIAVVETSRATAAGGLRRQHVHPDAGTSDGRGLPLLGGHESGRRADP